MFIAGDLLSCRCCYHQHCVECVTHIAGFCFHIVYILHDKHDWGCAVLSQFKGKIACRFATLLFLFNTTANIALGFILTLQIYRIYTNHKLYYSSTNYVCINLPDKPKQFVEFIFNLLAVQLATDLSARVNKYLAALIHCKQYLNFGLQLYIKYK